MSTPSLSSALLEEHAVAVVAVDQHEAQRIQIDLIGLRGEVVLLLRELGAVGDRPSCRWRGTRGSRGASSSSVGWPPPVELVEVDGQHRDALVFGGGADRVGEVPQQRLGTALAARFLRPRARADRRSAARRSGPRAAITSAAFARHVRHRHAQRADDETRRSPAAAAGAGTCAAHPGRATVRRRIARRMLACASPGVRSSPRSSPPCRTGHAGSTAWRGARCRGA